MIATSYYHGNWFVISTPFNRSFVESLKTHIPAHAREWDGGAKLWKINAPFAPIASRVIRTYFPDADIPETPNFQNAPHSPNFRNPSVNTCQCRNDPDAARLFILPTAPLPVVTAVYRALSKELHPDCGGSDDEMQELNSAYERLKERLVDSR